MHVIWQCEAGERQGRELSTGVYRFCIFILRPAKGQLRFLSGDRTLTFAHRTNLVTGKFHGWRSLVGYSPGGHRESDTTERLHFQTVGTVPSERILCIIPDDNLSSKYKEHLCEESGFPTSCPMFPIIPCFSIRPPSPCNPQCFPQSSISL